MTFALRETAGISRQRSYWLRCFLGLRRVSIGLAIGVSASGSLHAQVMSEYDCFSVRTVKVSHIRGQVVDQRGDVISGAKIEVLKKGAFDPLATTDTDANGSFQLSAPSGPLWVHLTKPGFAPVGLSVRVNHGLFSFLNARRLYVVLPLGMTREPCPAEMTSKKQLEKYLRHYGAQK